jgi:hypothetical protein
MNEMLKNTSNETAQIPISEDKIKVIEDSPSTNLLTKSNRVSYLSPIPMTP